MLQQGSILEKNINGFGISIGHSKMRRLVFLLNVIKPVRSCVVKGKKPKSGSGEYLPDDSISVFLHPFPAEKK